MLKRLTYLS